MTLLALTLRLLPITWGAGLRPHEGFYHPDEPKVFTSTAGFPGNYLSNPILIYGTAVQYVLGAALVPAKLLWSRVLRPHPFEHYAHFVLLVERAAHVLLGTSTVLVVHALGLQLFGRRVAGIAAALLAVSPLHVLNSALATLDVPTGFLATLVLLLALRAFDSERRRDFAWLGVAAGALLGTKITAAIVLVAPLTLLATRPVRRLALLSALAGGIALAVFVVTTPSVVVHTGGYLAFMSSQHANWVASRPHDFLSVLTVQAAALRAGLGWPAAVLSIAGLAIAMARRPGRNWRPAHVAVLAVVLSHVLLWRGYAPARFVLLVVPVLCIYAALPLAVLLTDRSLTRGLGLTALVLAFAVSGWATMNGLRQRMGDDPRTVAARAIAAAVPHGATLALAPTTMGDPWTGHAWRYPRLAKDDYVLTSPFAGPEYIVTTSYVLDRMVAALAARPERDEEERPEGRWYHGRAPSPGELGFYRSLLDGSAGYTLARSWKPAVAAPIEFAAPEIRLYERAVPGRSVAGALAGTEKPR